LKSDTPEGRTVTLTYHHADVSNPLNVLSNVVTAAPVAINMGQARLSLLFEVDGRRLHFDLEGRLQDGQPRPDRGSAASVEAGLKVDF